MGTHNVCLYKELDKQYTGCNLKTMVLLDCELIEVCVVFRANTIFKKVQNILQTFKLGGMVACYTCSR